MRGVQLLVAGFAALMLAVLILSVLLPQYAWAVRIPLGAALCLAFIVLIRRQAKRMEEISEQKNYVLSREIGLAAQCGNMLSFVFQRRGSEILSYRDQLTSDGSAAKSAPKTVSEMEQMLNVREEDQRRITETAAKLKPGEISTVHLHTSSNEGDRTISVQLKCMRNTPEIIIGCAIDCTQKIVLQEKAEAVAAYAASIQPKCMSQWQIDATDGVWRCLYSSAKELPKALGMETDAWTGYEPILTGTLKDHIDPQDYYGYVEAMSCEGICAMFRSGKTEFTQEYRVQPKTDANGEWHRQIVRVFENPENGHILCDLFVQNVNAEKKAEFERRERAKVMQKSLTALGGVFFGLYYVDLVNNLCYTTKARGGEIVSKLCTPYPEMLNDYVAKYVHPDDREAFLAAIDAYKLRRSFVEGARYVQMGFRGLRGDQYYWSSMFIQPARFENGSLCDVVIALQRSEKTVSKAE